MFAKRCLRWRFADKVLGKAEKLGLIDASDTPAIPMDDETALGKLLLKIGSSARAAGLEPERALREATRELKFAPSSWIQITMLVSSARIKVLVGQPSNSISEFTKDCSSV